MPGPGSTDSSSTIEPGGEVEGLDQQLAAAGVAGQVGRQFGGDDGHLAAEAFVEADAFGEPRRHAARLAGLAGFATVTATWSVGVISSA